MYPVDPSKCVCSVVAAGNYMRTVRTKCKWKLNIPSAEFNIIIQHDGGARKTSQLPVNYKPSPPCRDERDWTVVKRTKRRLRHRKAARDSWILGMRGSGSLKIQSKSAVEISCQASGACNQRLRRPELRGCLRGDKIERCPWQIEKKKPLCQRVVPVNRRTRWRLRCPDAAASHGASRSG